MSCAVEFGVVAVIAVVVVVVVAVVVGMSGGRVAVVGIHTRGKANGWCPQIAILVGLASPGAAAQPILPAPD